MSHHDRYGNPDKTRTLVGFGQLAETPTFVGAGEPGLVQIGARVGRTGQLFEMAAPPGSGPLVLKLIGWGAGLPERVVREFTRDAMTVANLRHPHVVQVVDAGALPDGTPFVVMERLRGRTLEEAADGRPVPTAELVAILRGVASALSAAHAAGVAHGELRADNIFMADVPGYPRGFPKLLDFGVARLTAAVRADFAGGVDVRTDQPALAALTHRLLAGTVAPSVDRVLFRALSADPDQRFDSVASFFGALQDALTAVEPAAETAASPQGAPAASAPEPGSLTQQFFAAGEKQELAQAAGAAGEPIEDDDDDAAAVVRRSDHVPRSRLQMLAAASLALASVAVIGGTIVSLSRAPDAGGPLAMATMPPAVLSAQAPPAAAVAPVQARAAVGHVRTSRVSGRRSSSRTEPPPVAPAALVTGVVARPDVTAPTPSVAAAPPSPAALPPAGAMPPLPIAEPQAPPAAGTVVSPAAAPPAAPIDEDVTQPWEQTEGEPPAPAPAPSAPPEPAAP